MSKPLQHACPSSLIQTKVVIKWRGKPVFIRHRTSDEIKEAQEIDWKNLRDPQPDEDRVQKPEWLVMLGEHLPGLLTRHLHRALVAEYLQ